MRRIYSLLLVALIIPAGLFARQNDAAVKYAKTITESDMKAKLTVLASDEFGGRETGTEGQKKASAYLEDFYKNLGLFAPVDGTYRQKFSMYQSDWSEVYVKAGETKLMNGKDIVFRGNANMMREQKFDVVYVGNTSTMEGMNVTGKVVISTARDRSSQKLLFDMGARAILEARENEEQFIQGMPRFARMLGQSRLRFTETPENDEERMLFYMTVSNAADILNTTKEKLLAAQESPTDIKAGTVKIFAKRKIKTIDTENMMAFLEGTDKKDEVLVISSHYDHIGTNADGAINNGADDDGSGTTGVMEIAEAFVQAAKEGHRPRRSILFLNVTGEEKGLLGSAYYADHPIYPLDKTINNLNIDMIGRVDPEHENDREYVYVIGSEKLSSHLKVISEFANITYTNLKLDYKFDDPNDTNRIYYRSDHYNFAKNGIPIIFYFNGTHADYHRPTDTVDKIEFDVMAKRAKLVFHTAWILANREARTPVDRTDDMTYNRD